jgi:Reticulon
MLIAALVTALAEIMGKFVMGTGVTASFRPRRYYRVPKETLETFLDDVEQLINFFVIEFQRVLFAENPAATVGVCPFYFCCCRIHMTLS